MRVPFLVLDQGKGVFAVHFNVLLLRVKSPCWSRWTAAAEGKKHHH